MSERKRPAVITLLDSVSKHLLSIESLDEVLDACRTCACKWRQIGNRIGLKYEFLEKIGVKCNNDPDTCLMETLAAWLRRNYKESMRFPLPSWWMLCRAIATAGEDNALANSVAQAHQDIPQDFTIYEDTTYNNNATMDRVSHSHGDDCGCGQCMVEDLKERPCPKPSRRRHSSIVTITNPKKLPRSLSLPDGEKMESQTQHTETIIRQFRINLFRTVMAIKKRNIDLQDVWTFILFYIDQKEQESLPIEASTSYEQIAKFLPTITSWYHFELVEDMAKEFVAEESFHMWSEYRSSLCQYAESSAAAMNEKIIGVRMNEKFHELNVTKDIPRLRATLAKCLKIDRTCLHFITVLENPRQVIFGTSDSMTTSLTTEYRSELASVGVTHVEDQSITLPVVESDSDSYFEPEEVIEQKLHEHPAEHVQQDLEEHNAELVQQLDTMTQQYQILLPKVGESEDVIKELLTTLEEVQRQYSQESIEKGYLQNRVENISQELNLAREEINDLQQQLQAIQSTNESLRERLQRESLRRTEYSEDNEHSLHLLVADQMQTIERLHQQLNVEQITQAELQQQLQESVTRLQETREANLALEEHNQHSSWLLRREEIEMSQELVGRGGWGEVRVANFRGLRVAAKYLHDVILSPYNVSLFVREMEIASKVRHPNLVQFIGATREGNAIILSELMPTSLRRELETGSPLPYPAVLNISLDVACALNYLHLFKPHPILHRDVTSPNVLLQPITSGWKAKLSDYGSANIQNLVGTTACPGNALYSAPESPNPSLHSPFMDVYSFGVLLLEMAIGRAPLVEHRDQHIEAIEQVAIKLLIQNCLMVNRDARPTVVAIIRELNDIVIAHRTEASEL